jgi:hypothetical protein
MYRVHCFRCFRSIFIELYLKNTILLIFSFFIQNVEYLHKYEAVPTKTYKTVNMYQRVVSTLV